MSEDDKQAPTPPEPKKETVRVTLKGDGDEAPKPADSAAPSAPAAPKPPAPAPTIPLKPASAAPKTDAPKPAAPAPTVQLKAPGATTAPKTTPLKTQPLTAGGDADTTQALPKATVQLGAATQALGAPTALGATQAATLQTAVDEEEKPDTVAGVLSLVAFLVALAVLGLQLMTASKWVSEEPPVSNSSGWNALLEFE
ncbi:MAG: hypothetical protein CMP28_00095 [Roseibacillus sp.]|nr:hypothetical protein [Roseibacillus sp.]